MKNYSIRRQKLSEFFKSPSFWVSIFAFLVLYIPVFILIIFSFNNSPHMVFPLKGFTIRWYSDLFQDKSILRSLLNTVIVGFSAVLISIILGSITAIAVFRYKYKFNNILTTIINFPIILPAIMVGLSLLIFFNYLNIGLSLYTVIMAHVTFCIPVIFKTVLARLRLLPKNLIEASLDLYANYWGTIIRIILPSIKTAVIAGGLMAFTLSFDETLITLLVTGTDTTLPMRIWALMRRGFTPEVNALATLMFVFSISVAAIWGIRMRKAT